MLVSYIVLQKDKIRYTFQYDTKLNKYDERRDETFFTGGTFTINKVSVEKALEKIEKLKREGFLEFKDPRQVSWYATVENNTPYQEIWKENDGYFVPIDSHSVGAFTVDGCTCEKVDEWENGKERFVLGNAIDDKEFYYAFEKSNRQKIYEFDHRPSRDEVENKHIDFIAEQALNLYEEEFGADGTKAFLGMNKDGVEVFKGEEKTKEQILEEILELAKKELKEAGDDIGYTMPDGKYHFYIYLDEVDEKIYVVEPNRVENGAHDPFTGDTYGAEFGDFEELKEGCMWAMECFEKDMELQNVEKISLKEFLHHFDFGYEVMLPDEVGESKHREDLFEINDILEEDLDSPMLCLVDLQGANYGDIEGNRFRLDEDLAKNIVGRMSVYVEDYITKEFMEALHDRDIMTDNSFLSDMVRKAKEVGVGSDEVSYQMATYVLNPELIDISAALEKGRQSSKKNGIEKESLEDRIGAVKEGLSSKESETFPKIQKDRLERE